MRHFQLFFAALTSLFILSGCGAVLLDQPANSTQNQEQQEQEQVADQPQIDCDAFMQSLADNCFQITAFDNNGQPLHIIDDDGNDLGEVDQNWAASYCSCYAQLAFQKFGCFTVAQHEELDDATYAETYAPIIDACYAESDSPEDNQVNDDTNSADTAADSTDNGVVVEETAPEAN